MGAMETMDEPLASVANSMGFHDADQPAPAPSSLEPELPPDPMQSTLGSNTTEQTLLHGRSGLLGRVGAE
eukprot:6356877-Alexandrium_andersonii.AAC.1